MAIERKNNLSEGFMYTFYNKKNEVKSRKKNRPNLSIHYQFFRFGHKTHNSSVFAIHPI